MFSFLTNKVHLRQVRASQKDDRGSTEKSREKINILTVPNFFFLDLYRKNNSSHLTMYLLAVLRVWLFGIISVL